MSIRVAHAWRGAVLELKQAVPGLHMVGAIALLSRYIHELLPGPVLNKAVSEVLIAVLLGLWVRNHIGYSARFGIGIRYSLNRLLRIGIILLGLRLSLQDVLSTGASALLLVLACAALALAVTYTLGRMLGLPVRLAALLGVGTAICGNSAIIATAPVIEARDEEVSFAVATITLFGTLAVIIYPLLGHTLGFSDREFGMWAGTAVNDTSMVVAAGAAYSSAALDIATVVKLTRNTLMVPAVLLIGVVYARARRSAARSETAGGSAGHTIAPVVPWFVVGFLAMVLLRTAGVAAGILPQNLAEPGNLQAGATFLRIADELSKLAILMALSAIGLGTSIAAMRRTGPRPFVAGLMGASVLALFSVLAIQLMGL